MVRADGKNGWRLDRSESIVTGVHSGPSTSIVCSPVWRPNQSVYWPSHTLPQPFGHSVL